MKSNPPSSSQSSPITGIMSHESLNYRRTWMSSTRQMHSNCRDSVRTTALISLETSQIHPPPLISSPKIVCNQFSRGVYAMLGAVSPDSFDTLHSYCNTFQMPFITPWFPEKVKELRSLSPDFTSNWLTFLPSRSCLPPLVPWTLPRACDPTTTRRLSTRFASTAGRRSLTSTTPTTVREGTELIKRMVTTSPSRTTPPSANLPEPETGQRVLPSGEREADRERVRCHRVYARPGGSQSLVQQIHRPGLFHGNGQGDCRQSRAGCDARPKDLFLFAQWTGKEGKSHFWN